MNTTDQASTQNAKAVAGILTTLLADEFLLYTKSRNAHWNAEGVDFHYAHSFFEKQYGELDEIIDNVAERIRSIDQYAPATLKSFLQYSQLSEMDETTHDSRAYFAALAADHSTIISYLRSHIDKITGEYGDAGTGDFITGIMAAHEKMRWALRSHLK